MNESNQSMQFLEAEIPLKEGNYEIQVAQTISEGGQEHTTQRATHTLRLEGEKSVNGASWVSRVYPPAFSEGNFGKVLPSISLSRASLPWERVGQKGNPKVPWLALLVFRADETVSTQSVPLSEIPEMLRPTGEFTPGSTATVLEVERTLFESLVHSAEQLRWMSHVQQGTDEAGQVIFKEATLLHHRFPKKGVNTAHLVSLENRWNEEGKFIFQDSETTTVQMISLHSWSYTITTDSDIAFLVAAGELAQSLSTLKLPLATADNEAKIKLAQGLVALPYQISDGSASAGWYHGPLATGPTQSTALYSEQNEAFDSSDRWLRYFSKEGLYDTSYALAWELGRLLALQNTRFATGLYQWKRQHLQHMHHGEQRAVASRLLPLTSERKEDKQEIPDYVRQWLVSLTNLEGIPFSYLVPDERMCPVESLRVFRLNVSWVQALVYGAMSLGGKTEASTMLAEVFSDSDWETREKYSGLLLRSQVVKDWPDLFVEGVDVTLVRQVKLAPDTLFCLFDGTPKSLYLENFREVRHFAWESDLEASMAGDEVDYRVVKLKHKTITNPAEMANYLVQTRQRVVINL
ncbi:MAG: hypothetical protein AAFQ98_22725 [Bacteroidota bacterium]